MALLLDASGDYPQLDNALTLTLFTVMGWTYVESDLGSGTTQSLVMTTANVGVDADAFARWETPVDGIMDVGSYDGSTANVTDLGSRPGTGVWFHWFLQCSGGGGNQLKFGWRGVADLSYVTATATLEPGSTGVANLVLGNNGFGEYLNGRFAAIKVWDAVLNDIELFDDSEQYLPIRTANLVSANIDDSGTVAGALLAYAPGGGGINLVEHGALAISAGPPIPFGGGGGASPRNLPLLGVG